MMIDTHVCATTIGSAICGDRETVAAKTVPPSSSSSRVSSDLDIAKLCLSLRLSSGRLGCIQSACTLTLASRIDADYGGTIYERCCVSS